MSARVRNGGILAGTSIMSPIPLKRIVSVSSEDNQNPASNLLTPSSGRKWLCSQSNRSRTAYVVVELSKRVRISSLELCNFGSAFVEVLVSDSESPDSYVTLLHMCMLMSLQEARMGRNKTKVVSYGKAKLSTSATSRKWNLVKVHCVQKYNHEDQFGLRSFSIFSDGHNLGDQGPNPSLLCPALRIISPQSSSQQLSESRRRKEGLSHLQQHHKLPSSSDSLLVSAKVGMTNARGGREHVSSDSSTTPKRLLKTPNNKKDYLDQEDFEFSGLERQSRLFRNCIRGRPEDTESSGGKGKQNNILSKIAADKEKYRESGGLYPRKKLLKKELPKAELMSDFVASYKAEEKGSSEIAGAIRIMSSHDNDYEIGEEPEMTWSWNKFKGKPKKSGRGSCNGRVSGWINKRKKLSNMILQCSDIFEKAGHGEQVRTSPETPAVTSEKGCDEATDSDSDTIIYSSPNPSPSTVNGVSSGASSLVECPLCLSFFPLYAIELHASVCGSDQEQRTAAISNAVVLID